jgi:hypothetical protein
VVHSIGAWIFVGFFYIHNFVVGDSLLCCHNMSSYWSLPRWMWITSRLQLRLKSSPAALSYSIWRQVIPSGHPFMVLYLVINYVYFYGSNSLIILSKWELFNYLKWVSDFHIFSQTKHLNIQFAPLICLLIVLIVRLGAFFRNQLVVHFYYENFYFS